jgi:hypothetical protein
MKQIPLTRGEFALVDDDKYDFLMQWNWVLHRQGGRQYAVRFEKKNGRTKGIRLHRLLMNATDSKLFIDHINGNGLDNQMHNLRFATNSQNQGNRGAPINNTSEFKGVSYAKRLNRYRASITVDGKYIGLGYYNTAADAGHAYNVAANKYFGEYARLNMLPDGYVFNSKAHEKEKFSKSGHRNIYIGKRGKYNVAILDENQKQKHIGSFNTIEEAIEARDGFFIEKYGSVTRPNNQRVNGFKRNFL